MPQPAHDPHAHGREEPIIYLTTAAVAQTLGVYPNAVRDWSERFGFPRGTMQDGKRSFDASQIEALRVALSTEATIEQAIAAARASCEPN